MSSHRERVLLIEPCSTTASIISDSLRDHGYAVTWFESAEKALPHLVSPPWFGRGAPGEVVLACVDELDVELRTFAEIVRLAETPLVLFGAVEPESLFSARAFLCKPLAMDDLLSCVRKSLRRERAKVKAPEQKESFYGDLTRVVPVLS